MQIKDRLEKHFKLREDQRKALGRLGIGTVDALLRYLPVRYGDTAEAKQIRDLSPGDTVSIFGRISKLQTKKSFRTKIPMASAKISDDTGSIPAVWFNQAYIAKMFSEDMLVKVSGKVSENKAGLFFSNPQIEAASEVPTIAPDSLFGEAGKEFTLYPVYNETKGVTSTWIYHAIQRIFKSGILDELPDPIPKHILEKYHLPSLSTALVWIHAPRKIGDFEAARKRFSFEEIFLIQLQRQRERKEVEKMAAAQILDAAKLADVFAKTLPFTLTEGQRKAVKDITDDLSRDFPMSRLLEGDVGSGKTAVAASISYATISTAPKDNRYGRLQVAYMAPTEILAAQHFESFISFFKHMPVEIGLMTGSVCKKFPSKVDPSGTTQISKAQLQKWVLEGKISILIGTHSLIQKKVKFKNLGLAVIDEQHRFGIRQRKELSRKDGVAPHLLSMTATPIPRTLALTIYGDLDLSILDEMPKGRKQTVTQIVLPKDRSKTYEEIRKELLQGRQLYVICPRINEPDPTKEKAVNAKSVTEEAKRLKSTVFKEFSIGILHSKMTPKEKEKVMKEFSEKKTDILVATSVVEVGVNVPNASLMIIEGAERFGLAQLHQLRGRIIRGNHQPYCFVFAESQSDKTIERLKAFTTAKNGFELSELDLSLRGAGELSGGSQWGVSDIAMEALRNLKMVEAAREEARELISKDPDLLSFPLLHERVKEKEVVHFE